MSEINITRTQEAPVNQEVMIDNNQVYVAGVIEYDLQYSHEANSRKFYVTRLNVKRTSGVEDHIPIMISEEVKNNISESLLKGKFAEVEGNVRVYKRKGNDGKRHTYLYVYAIKIKLHESALPIKDNNRIYLEGNIVRKAFSNKKLGFEKKVTILIIEVNRYHRVYDRIPCLAWNKTSEYVSALELKSKIKIEGKLESRLFMPKNATEYKETYQVSIIRVIKN